MVKPSVSDRWFLTVAIQGRQVPGSSPGPSEGSLLLEWGNPARDALRTTWNCNVYTWIFETAQIIALSGKNAVTASFSKDGVFVVTRRTPAESKKKRRL